MSNSECPICMEECTRETECITTDCKHTFHKKCMEQWVNRKRWCVSCPVCRTSLTSLYSLVAKPMSSSGRLPRQPRVSVRPSRLTPQQLRDAVRASEIHAARTHGIEHAMDERTLLNDETPEERDTRVAEMVRARDVFLENMRQARVA